MGCWCHPCKIARLGGTQQNTRVSSPMGNPMQSTACYNSSRREYVKVNDAAYNRLSSFHETREAPRR